MASNCSNPDLEDEQFTPMEESSIPSPDDDESADRYDTYSDTISDIVSRVMSMNNAPKRQSLLLGRLRQSLPPLPRPAVSATPCNFTAAPQGTVASRDKQPARSHLCDNTGDLLYSSSKMVRSVSTPEISDKYSYNPPRSLASELRDKKMPIIRKMNFLDLPQPVKLSSGQDLPMMDLDSQFDSNLSAKEADHSCEADVRAASAVENKENICPSARSLKEDGRKAQDRQDTSGSHSAASKHSADDAFKEPHASLYPRRHPPSSNPLLRDVHMSSSCSYFGSKASRSALPAAGSGVAAARGACDVAGAGQDATSATPNSRRPFLPWSTSSNRNAEPIKFGRDTQLGKYVSRGYTGKSLSSSDIQRNSLFSKDSVPTPVTGADSQSTIANSSYKNPLVCTDKNAIPFVVITSDFEAKDVKLADHDQVAQSSSDQEGKNSSCASSSRLDHENSNSSPNDFEKSNLSSSSLIGDSTLRNDSSCSKGDCNSTSDLLDGLTVIDPSLQSALKKLDASFNSTHSTTITNILMKQCSTNSKLNLVANSTTNSTLGSVYKPSTTVSSNTSCSLPSAPSAAASTIVHATEQKSLLDSHSHDVLSRTCNSESKSLSTTISFISSAQSQIFTSVTAVPTPVYTISAPVQVTGTSVATPSNSVQITPTAIQVTLAPVQGIPAPIQVTPAPVQGIPACAQATAAPVQATSTSVQVTSSSGAAASAPVQSAPATVQAVPAPFPCMESLSVNGKQYMKLSLLGRGGSSEVYEVVSMETRAVVALKLVQLTSADEQMVSGYRNEIAILRQLQGTQRVITLYDFEETADDLRIVMERGSHDLACVLKNARTQPCQPISSFTVQHYWQGMLLAVQAIHQQGIIHSDLKPANFLLVKDVLKLIDFGIASSIQVDMTSVLKDSQAGTFNYMSPESLNDVHSGPIINGKAGDKPIIKIGTKSDVWSLGCILYNLVYTKTPFQHLTNPWQKLAAISNPKTVIHFPPCQNPDLLNTMQLCLQFQPHKRPTIQQLLEHPYLTGVGKSVVHVKS